ncbi:hypothetical protein ZWY2020_020256 [Hordeum vulgare]|nr:hypothetical protein ZWY2020_020256 [Hordeum vulgare]
MASTLRDNDEWGDNDEREDPGDSYSLDEEYMVSDGVFSQRFASKHLRQIAKSKLNPTKRKFIDETGFGDLKNISPFIVLHDLMEWLEMNIDTGKRELRPNQNKVIVFTRDMVKKVFDIPPGNRTVVLYKRHEQCELRNIYHKNCRAPISHTVHALQKARNDNGGTTKRSWVLLALATVLTPGTGNMVPLEYLKSHKDIEKVTEYSWDAHVLSVAINEVKKYYVLCYRVIYMDHLIFPQAAINEHQMNYSLPRACFVQQNDFDIVWEDIVCIIVSRSRSHRCCYRQQQRTTKDVYCDDTKDCGATNVNINGNKGDVGAKDNYIGDIDPMENWKSVEEDVCGSLDDSLQNPVPFGVELEVRLFLFSFKRGTNSFVQVLQAMHYRKMGQLLRDVDLVSSSNQQTTYVTFDIPPHCNNDEPKADGHGGSKQTCTSKASHERGGSKQSYSRKVADEPTINKVVEQVEGGEDVEHGPQLSHLDHSGMASVGGHWSDTPSMSVFQEGTEEYNWCIGIPSAAVDPNASNHKNTVATPKTPKSFGAPKPQEEPVVLLSSREPGPYRDEEKVRLKEEKKLKSKKITVSLISAGAKYKKIKTYDNTEAMYQYIVMKRPPFIRIGDFYITYSNFQKSLKPRAQMCNEVMSLFIERFNIEYSSFLLPSTFIILICPCLPCCNTSSFLPCQYFLELQLSFHQEVFVPSVCAKELRRACEGFTNFKRIVAEDPDFSVDLNSFNFDCGYFGVLYFENFDGKRTKDFKKQNMLDLRKYLSSKLFYHPLNKVSPADMYKAIVAARRWTLHLFLART